MNELIGIIVMDSSFVVAIHHKRSDESSEDCEKGQKMRRWISKEGEERKRTLSDDVARYHL